MVEPEKRQASRLILLDSDQRILLFRHTRSSGETFWAPPGGGLEYGETFEQAALREASEELGIKDGLSLIFIWEKLTEFVYIDRPVRQQERFFLVKCDLAKVLSNVQKIHQEEGIVETRWWTIPDLESTKEPVFPEELTSVILRISN